MKNKLLFTLTFALIALSSNAFASKKTIGKKTANSRELKSIYIFRGWIISNTLILFFGLKKVELPVC